MAATVRGAVMVWPHFPVMEGRDAIMEVFRVSPHAPEYFYKHAVIDPWVKVDGDRAHARSFFFVLANTPQGPELQSYGRYDDELVRQDERWRFSRRVCELENIIPNWSPPEKMTQALS